MNKLGSEKKQLVVKCLVDGMSIRATERITGVHRDTIMRLMVKLGNGCAILLDEAMRGLHCARLEVDEIWSFVQKKQKTVKKQKKPRKNKDFGDAWVFIAIDPDSKLVPVHRVGIRNLDTATKFMEDVRGRMVKKIQMSTDALRTYEVALDDVFDKEIDYGQVIKVFETDDDKDSISPEIAGESCIGKNIVFGKPDPRLISTALVERQNLTMRMGMRRFTRKTNGFSKKLENHKAAIALHFGHYNFARVHQTIKTSPAAGAGLISGTWSIPQLIDEAEQANERQK